MKKENSPLRCARLCVIDKPAAMFQWIILASVIMSSSSLLFAQQVADTSFAFPLEKPTYATGSGPVVCIDEAHHNFHTMDGNFLAFARLLSMDGYQVKPMDQKITKQNILETCDILVISNALDVSDTEEWVVPNPSAFSETEIVNIQKWVSQGGSLFLIADHMPFGGAAYDLGKAFGFEWLNGFAFTRPRTWPPSVFKTSEGTLATSPVTSAEMTLYPIDSVITFTGSAFRIPPGAIPVLAFLPEHQSLQPDTAWVFTEETPRIHLEGYYQGALLDYGKGRVSAFGEAAMFTAQIANGTIKAGFNSETAPQNAVFLLNIMHWLSQQQWSR